MSQRAPAEAGWLSRGLDAAREALLSAVGIGFFTAMVLVAGAVRRMGEIEGDFGFLRWNLFLAWIPLVLAYALTWAARSRITWIALPPLALLWIVFLPNAPYLITDLVHLHEAPSVINAIVLGLLAFTGLLIGVKSVQLVHNAVETLWGERAGWRAVQVIAFLVALGVYLGRVLRWNSWTIILHPHELAHVVLRSPSEPGRVAFGLIGVAVFAAAFYLSYRVLTGPRSHAARLAPASARAAGDH
jgi:uncharacterized membrane protein